jgi:hypothetical protein
MVMRGVLTKDLNKNVYGYVLGITTIFCYLWLAVHIVMNGGYAAQDFGNHVSFLETYYSASFLGTSDFLLRIPYPSQIHHSYLCWARYQ